ncbi:MAG: GNAT family N-acetyltransferase [Gemmatimonadetes bacterium]|nr:GNAT family N-acetyltransferase [Gemmatimonadota bacterium]MYG84431.1 GNAT family N-acetyltransferase [Gemmatimonadota bacterium]MYJ88652.1 GNAT family N-acetyltransferase [Gemmatimonadota bacterium]
MEGPRGLKAQEFDSLCTLVNTVFRGDGVGRMEEQYPLLFAPDNYDELFVMVDEGVVVSHVGALTRDISVLGCRMSTMSIGAVATYESHRGRGLATQLMEAAVRKAVAQDAVLMPISGGRGLYTRLGAKRIGQYALYTVPRDTLPACDGPGSGETGADETAVGETDIQLAGPEDLHEMTRLYAEEPSRYVRSTADLRMAVDAAWICDRDGETVVIREEGRLVAYVAIQKRRPDRDDEARRARLAEIAGSRSALVRALPCLYDRYDVDYLEIVTTASDIELSSLLRPHGVTAAPQGFSGTVLVLQPERLLQVFEDYITDVLGRDVLTWDASADAVVFRCGKKDHAVATGDLGTLVFGVVPPDQDPIETIPPGLLRTALARVFPVQLPWYGFNFV